MVHLGLITADWGHMVDGPRIERVIYGNSPMCQRARAAGTQAMQDSPHLVTADVGPDRFKVKTMTLRAVSLGKYPSNKTRNGKSISGREYLVLHYTDTHSAKNGKPQRPSPPGPRPTIHKSKQKTLERFVRTTASSTGGATGSEATLPAATAAASPKPTGATRDA